MWFNFIYLNGSSVLYQHNNALKHSKQKLSLFFDRQLWYYVAIFSLSLSLSFPKFSIYSARVCLYLLAISRARSEPILDTVLLLHKLVCLFIIQTRL